MKYLFLLYRNEEMTWYWYFCDNHSNILRIGVLAQHRGRVPTLHFFVQSEEIRLTNILHNSSIYQLKRLKMHLKLQAEQRTKNKRLFIFWFILCSLSCRKTNQQFGSWCVHTTCQDAKQISPLFKMIHWIRLSAKAHIRHLI